MLICATGEEFFLDKLARPEYASIANRMFVRARLRPLTPDEDKLDIALREIGEGKLIAEVDFDAVAKHEADQTKWS